MSVLPASSRRPRAARSLAIAAILAPATLLSPAPALAQAPTVVEAVCLQGGRADAVCACAEKAMRQELGPAPYADYEAMAAAYLQNPSDGWSSAAALVADLKGATTERMLNAAKLYGLRHREAMADCG